MVEVHIREADLTDSQKKLAEGVLFDQDALIDNLDMISNVSSKSGSMNKSEKTLSKKYSGVQLTDGKQNISAQ
jgi:hypothetical protein